MRQASLRSRSVICGRSAEKAAAVEEVAGADADVEMAGARVAIVEREEVPLRAATDEPA